MLDYGDRLSRVTVNLIVWHVVVVVDRGGPKGVRVVGHDAAERGDARVEEERAFVPAREWFSTFEQGP